MVKAEKLVTISGDDIRVFCRALWFATEFVNALDKGLVSMSHQDEQNAQARKEVRELVNMIQVKLGNA